MTDAPLKENLAAAILMLADADPERPLLDPMAGSGTFAIEQAQRARKIAPGLQRRFAFERWPDQSHAAAWAQLREQARAVQLPSAPAPIIARDIAPEAIAAARRNAAAAGVAGDVSFEVGGISTLSPPFPSGTLLTNPPYGERLGAGQGDSPGEAGGAPVAPRSGRGAGAHGAHGAHRTPRGKAGAFARGGGPGSFGRDPSDGRDPGDRAFDRVGRAPRVLPGRGADPQTRAPGLDARDLEHLYDDLGRALGRFGAWNVGVLSGNPMFSRIFLRKPDINHRLFNGPLETRLLVYRPRAAR